MKLLNILVINILVISGAWAGGAITYEIGAPDNGWASAGRAAYSSDASTVYGNPAGLAYLDKAEVMIGLQPKYYTGTFEVEVPSVSPSPDLSTFIPNAGVFWASRFNKKFQFGIGVVSFMNMKLDYGQDWAGSQYVSKFNLNTIDLIPALSFSIVEKLSIAIAIDLYWGSFLQEFRDPSPSGAQIKLDEQTFGGGLSFGFLWEIDEGRFGVKYRSQAKLPFEFEVEGLGEKPTLDFYIPHEVTIGTSQKINKDWVMLLSFGWQNWSKLSNMSVQVGAIKDVISLDLKDSWHGSAGFKYLVGKKNELTFGAAWDTSAVEDENRTLLMPFNTQLRVSGGYLLHLSELSMLSLNITWVGSGKTTVDVAQGPRIPIKGTYKSNNLYTLGINYNWKW